MNLRNTIRIALFLLILTITSSVTAQKTTNQVISLASAPQILTTQLLSTSTITLSQSSSQICKINEVPNYMSVCLKPDYVEGCQIYQTSITCNKCSKGYKINKNKKCDYDPLYTGIIQHIVGCIKQSSSNICDICASGFYKKENKCQLGVKNCAQYNKNGECSECQIQYSLILSQCRHNNILGCKYQTQSHTCGQCYAPFQLISQHCDIQNCRILNDYGCVSCQCGFYLTVERTCQPISQGCLRYQRGVCKDCLPHYKLKGGVCQIEGCLQYESNYCKICSDKYQNVDGECHFKNCLDWLNDSCVLCKKGFALQKGLCIESTAILCS